MCKHQWEVIENIKFNPIFESVSKLDGRLTSEQFELFTRRGVVTISKCVKCGKVHHTKSVI